MGWSLLSGSNDLTRAWDERNGDSSMPSGSLALTYTGTGTGLQGVYRCFNGPFDPAVAHGVAVQARIPSEGDNPAEALTAALRVQMLESDCFTGAASTPQIVQVTTPDTWNVLQVDVPANPLYGIMRIELLVNKTAGAADGVVLFDNVLAH